MDDATARRLVSENDMAITAALREFAVMLANFIAETAEYGTEEHKQLLRDMLAAALAVLSK